jgi:DNA-binding HxlR family transcriptional regulator
MRPRKAPKSGCPIDYAATMFGDRWTMLVLRDIARGKRYFSEFATSDEGMAPNILASRLKHLEKFGILTRRVDPENRRQVIYELTQKGLDLTPIMIELTRWSAKHDPHTTVTKAFVEMAERDREGLIRETVKRLTPRR